RRSTHPRRTDAADECKASTLALLSGKEENERSEVNACNIASLVLASLAPALIARQKMKIAEPKE
ncbi:MAG: hypothetical protein LIO68_09365, partial [Rikenellaceae bacterium]|nr:hypothetical protein [Rikenellaceae bacterium]